MSLEQIGGKEAENFAELSKILSAAGKERLDYALNFIDETEKSLEIADNQPAVMEAIKEILAASSDSDAGKIARDKLQDLL